MTKCGECGQWNLPVTNSQIDSAILSTARPASWYLPDRDTAALVRGRVYYSARIHGVDISTHYKDGWLTVKDKYEV